MKVKRILSVVLTLAMTVSSAVSYITASAATEPTESYYKQSHTTTGANDFLSINLDEIFKTGETYKITYNLKPSIMTETGKNQYQETYPAYTTVEDGSFNASSSGLVNLYTAYDSSGASTGQYLKLGNQWCDTVTGISANVLTSGLDIEMIWNTSEGKVDVTAYFPQCKAYPAASARTKTKTWSCGTVGNGTYGTLKIGSKSASATVRDVRIRNITADPAGSYSMTSFTTEEDGYWRLPLDEIIKTGNKYELSWNMKPNKVDTSVNDGVAVMADILDGDISVNKNNVNYGFFDIYTESNNSGQSAHYHQLGSWKGNITGKADAIKENGVNMKLVWDTESSYITITASIGSDWTTTYSWEPGTVTSKYGFLAIGAANAAVTISNMSIRDITPLELETYYNQIYTTTGANDFLSINLDEIFKTGETYKITYNLKPSIMTETGKNQYQETYPAYTTVEDGSFNASSSGLVNLYTAYDSSGASTGQYLKLGNQWCDTVTGISANVLTSGLDIEMIWNTSEGKVDVTAYFPQCKAYPAASARTKTKTWSCGTVGNGTYGTLKIGSKSASATVRDVRIRNITADPAGSYSMTSFTTEEDGYWRLPLDEIIKTGNKYELSWNMKPNKVDTSVNDGVAVMADILDGDISVNKNNVNYGFFDIYTESNNSGQSAHYHQLGSWKGNITGKADAIKENGVNMKLVWDTESSYITITASIGSDWTTTYSWEPGTVTSKYGFLAIGAANAAVTISNMSIKQAAELEAPELSASDIKIYADAAEQNAAKASENTNIVKVDFGQAMYETDMAESNIYVVEKGTDTKLGTGSYANGIYTITFTNKLTPGKTYTVKIAKVRNAGGKYTSEEYSKDFKIIDSGVRAELVNVTKGEATVNGLNEFNGDVKINISYSNTTEATPTLKVIVAYYNGTRLVYADVKDQTTSSENKIFDYGVDYKVATLTESYDKIHIMVWDGLNTMVPLSDVLNIGN